MPNFAMMAIPAAAGILLAVVGLVIYYHARNIQQTPATYKFVTAANNTTNGIRSPPPTESAGTVYIDKLMSGNYDVAGCQTACTADPTCKMFSHRAPECRLVVIKP